VNYLETQSIAKDALLKALEFDKSGRVRWKCWQILAGKLDDSNCLERARWKNLYIEIKEMLIQEQEIHI
jgi:hypothetical protein